jgi:hypothetical protein
MGSGDTGSPPNPMLRADIDVEAEIGRLAGLNPCALRARWRDFYGSEAPVRMSSEIMLRAIAHRIQEQAFGGLSTSLRTKLRSAAKAVTKTGERKTDGRAHSPRVRRDRSVKPGTKFLREWNGRMIEVIAMADGRYLFEGEAHSSLSAVARKITGTRWSGPAFFGVGTKPGGRHS